MRPGSPSRTDSGVRGKVQLTGEAQTFLRSELTNRMLVDLSIAIFETEVPLADDPLLGVGQQTVVTSPVDSAGDPLVGLQEQLRLF